MPTFPPDSEVRAVPPKQRAVEPCIMVIFGASGDLTRRKLLPALYNLLLDGLLPRPFAVVGAARRPLTSEEFVEQLRAGVERHSRRELDADRWKELGAGITYCAVDEEDPESYRSLAEHLDAVEREHGTAGQPPVLPRHSAVRLSGHRHGTRRGRSEPAAEGGRLDEDRAGETDRPRPSPRRGN